MKNSFVARRKIQRSKFIQTDFIQKNINIRTGDILRLGIKIDEGKNDEQIYKYLKTKYGEWIVYDPEINKNTFLLWVLPLILFVFGAILIIKKVSIK